MSKEGASHPGPYPTQSNPMASAPPSYEEAMKHQVFHGQQTVPMSGPYPGNPTYPAPPGFPVNAAPGCTPGYAYYPGPPSHGHPYPQTTSVQPVYVQQVPIASTVYVQPGHFDGGARFNRISQPVVPPPPPGVMPNAAQLAAMQGGPVVVQKKNAKTTLTTFVMGKSDGGATFW